MDKYNKRHAVCPKCGSTLHSTTLVGYPMYSDKRKEYKDLNDCVCFNCGDKHIRHDRISIKKFNIKNELIKRWQDSGYLDNINTSSYFDTNLLIANKIQKINETDEFN